MSKIKKSELLDIVREQGSAITNLLQRVTLLEKPQLKQLDQSVFDGLDEKWRWATTDRNGRAFLFSRKPTASNIEWYAKSVFDYEKIGNDYDASNWQNSIIEREPQLEQLNQSIFDGLNENWQFAAVDSDGSAFAFVSKPENYGDFWGNSKEGQFTRRSGKGAYDASNWQNSLIEREDIARELLEVDLSSELTGSELCKAMLERGDKFIVCKLADTSEADAINNSAAKLVTKCDADGFYHAPADIYWNFAVPINNQGEPLTAVEAGL